MAEKVYWEIKENHVDEVIEASKKAITAAAKAVGVQAVSHAVTNITSQGAVDTGLLRNSLTFAIGGQGTKKKSYSGKKSKYTGKVPEPGGYDQTFPADEDGKRTVYIGTNVYYAPYVEMGHKTTSGKTVPARPYLKPAVEDNKAEYMQIIKEVIEKVDGISDVE